MEISFDPNKNKHNVEIRGLSFEQVAEFDFESALFETDTRRDYGEIRIRALGYLNERLHVLVFVETANGIRVISLRRANKREMRRYEQATQP
jgi:uncharacterized DUF497 family protein